MWDLKDEKHLFQHEFINRRLTSSFHAGINVSILGVTGLLLYQKIQSWPLHILCSIWVVSRQCSRRQIFQMDWAMKWFHVTWLKKNGPWCLISHKRIQRSCLTVAFPNLQVLAQKQVMKPVKPDSGLLWFYWFVYALFFRWVNIPSTFELLRHSTRKVGNHCLGVPA